jgi:hypothetical protein
MDHDTSTASDQVFPYKNLLGSAAFATLGTRPDIAFAIINDARFAHRPTPSHYSALKKVVAYLKGTKDYGISFHTSSNPNLLTAYCDVDYAMDLEDRKSHSGALLMLNNRPVTWLSRKQPCTTSSTTEADYLAAHVATKELLWERQLLNELGYPQLNPTPLFLITSRQFALFITLSSIRKPNILMSLFTSSGSIRPIAPSTLPTSLCISNSLTFLRKPFPLLGFSLCV